MSQVMFAADYEAIGEPRESMLNDRGTADRQRQQTPRARTDADYGGEVELDRGLAEGDALSAELARNEAEEVRRLAEEGREARDRQREALETSRQERERLRDDAETARVAGEDARGAAEAARQAVVDAVRATAETLDATLAHMKVVEEMRRTLREIQDVKALDPN